MYNEIKRFPKAEADFRLLPADDAERRTDTEVSPMYESERKERKCSISKVGISEHESGLLQK